MKKKICLLFLIACVFIISTSAIKNNDPQTSKVMVPFGVRDATGNPINLGAGNCSGCHSGTVNSGGSLKITVKDEKGNPVNTYDFNKSYSVDVTVARTSISMFGFDAEIVTSNNTDAGVVSSLDTTKIHTLLGERSTNITHFTPGKTKDSHTFTFKWKTPAADSGDVTIYAAGLAANGNDKNTGDYTYTSVKILTAISTNMKEEAKVISAVSIFPNPVSSAFTLTYTLKTHGDVKIDLYSLNGQKVAELVKESRVSGLQQEYITLPYYIKNGTYLLQINSRKEVAYQKVIINKAE